MTQEVDPTACAEDTPISGSTPVGGPADRCPDCGHLVMSHPLPGNDGCELCRFEVRLRGLELRASIEDEYRAKTMQPRDTWPRTMGIDYNEQAP